MTGPTNKPTGPVPSTSVAHQNTDTEQPSASPEQKNDAKPQTQHGVAIENTPVAGRTVASAKTVHPPLLPSPASHIAVNADKFAEIQQQATGFKGLAHVFSGLLQTKDATLPAQTVLDLLMVAKDNNIILNALAPGQNTTPPQSYSQIPTPAYVKRGAAENYQDTIPTPDADNVFYPAASESKPHSTSVSSNDSGLEDSPPASPDLTSTENSGVGNDNEYQEYCLKWDKTKFNAIPENEIATNSMFRNKRRSQKNRIDSLEKAITAARKEQITPQQSQAIKKAEYIISSCKEKLLEESCWTNVSAEIKQLQTDIAPAESPKADQDMREDSAEDMPLPTTEKMSGDAVINASTAPVSDTTSTEQPVQTIKQEEPVTPSGDDAVIWDFPGNTITIQQDVTNKTGPIQPVTNKIGSMQQKRLEAIDSKIKRAQEDNPTPDIADQLKAAQTLVDQAKLADKDVYYTPGFFTQLVDKLNSLIPATAKPRQQEATQPTKNQATPDDLIAKAATSDQALTTSIEEGKQLELGKYTQTLTESDDEVIGKQLEALGKYTSVYKSFGQNLKKNKLNDNPEVKKITGNINNALNELGKFKLIDNYKEKLSSELIPFLKQLAATFGADDKATALGQIDAAGIEEEPTAASDKNDSAPVQPVKKEKPNTTDPEKKLVFKEIKTSGQATALMRELPKVHRQLTNAITNQQKTTELEKLNQKANKAIAELKIATPGAEKDKKLNAMNQAVQAYVDAMNQLIPENQKAHTTEEIPSVAEGKGHNHPENTKKNDEIGDNDTDATDTPPPEIKYNLSSFELIEQQMAIANHYETELKKIATILVSERKTKDSDELKKAQKDFDIVFDNIKILNNGALNEQAKDIFAQVPDMIKSIPDTVTPDSSKKLQESLNSITNFTYTPPTIAEAEAEAGQLGKIIPADDIKIPENPEDFKNAFLTTFVKERNQLKGINNKPLGPKNHKGLYDELESAKKALLAKTLACKGVNYPSKEKMPEKMHEVFELAKTYKNIIASVREQLISENQKAHTTEEIPSVAEGKAQIEIHKNEEKQDELTEQAISFPLKIDRASSVQNVSQIQELLDKAHKTLDEAVCKREGVLYNLNKQKTALRAASTKARKIKDTASLEIFNQTAEAYRKAINIAENKTKSKSRQESTIPPAAKGKAQDNDINISLPESPSNFTTAFMGAFTKARTTLKDSNGEKISIKNNKDLHIELENAQKPLLQKMREYREQADKSPVAMQEVFELAKAYKKVIIKAREQLKADSNSASNLAASASTAEPKLDIQTKTAPATKPVAPKQKPLAKKPAARSKDPEPVHSLIKTDDNPVKSNTPTTVLSSFIEEKQNTQSVLTTKDTSRFIGSLRTHFAKLSKNTDLAISTRKQMNARLNGIFKEIMPKHLDDKIAGIKNYNKKYIRLSMESLLEIEEFKDAAKALDRFERDLARNAIKPAKSTSAGPRRKSVGNSTKATEPPKNTNSEEERATTPVAAAKATTKSAKEPETTTETTEADGAGTFARTTKERSTHLVETQKKARPASAKKQQPADSKTDLRQSLEEMQKDSVALEKLFTKAKKDGNLQTIEKNAIEAKLKALKKLKSTAVENVSQTNIDKSNKAIAALKDMLNKGKRKKR